MNAGVLVIGGGIAGSSVALGLADRGIPVAMITVSTSPEETASFHAQGGVVYRGACGDSPQILAEDIWIAGARCGSRGMIDLLSEKGPETVDKLLLGRLGISFDREPDGRLSLAREAAHCCPRIIHSRDATGSVIMKAMHAEVASHPLITVFGGHAAAELITGGGRCLGAEVITCEGRVECFYADAVVLATGGAGSLFRRTSNPPGSLGHGAALAARAGAELMDMEYVQFHPTALAFGGVQQFLISEAARGAGARLVDANNIPFMQKYDPDWKDLAPRDVVTRAVWSEMRNRGLQNVYLNFFDYIPRQNIINGFPTIYGRCLQYGIDITAELLPVAPASHFICGGVAVNSRAETSIPGLYAVGECSRTGVHGANRLASTSLLEGICWAELAAENISETLPMQNRRDDLPVKPVVGSRNRNSISAEVTQQILNFETEIRDIMWEEVGIIRTRQKLSEAVSELKALKTAADDIYLANTPSVKTAGLRNMTSAAVLIAEAALRNGVSRGSHFIVS